MSEAVLFEQHGHVVTLTLNRPEARNPISEPDVIDALEAAVARISADLSVRALILTGAGSAFSSGGNIKHMRDRTGMFGGSPAEVRTGYRRGIQRIPKALWELEVPTIAAINGPAVGAGCDLACMCDLRIASDKASFAESFVKVGIIPGDGGAWLLPRVVGAAEVCGDALRDPETLRLSTTMELGESSEYNARFPAERWAEVEIRLDDGRVLRSKPHTARGDPETALSEAEIRHKFVGLAEPVVGAPG